MTYKTNKNRYPSKTAYTLLPSTNPYVITLFSYIWNSACWNVFIYFSSYACYPCHADITNQYRDALLGSSIVVRFHCHNPLLMTLKPCSIHALIPYKQALDASGGKSVSMNHASSSPSSQCAIKVHSRRFSFFLNARP